MSINKSFVLEFLIHYKISLCIFAFIYTLYIGRLLRYIPNNKIGIVEKLFSLKGSVKSGVIARKDEAGYQPNVLRGGWHIMVPFIYRVHRVPLVTVPQGYIGYVFARDGLPLKPEQTLASNVEAFDFEDVEDFLDKGGQKGPQRKILREGTYAINLAQFVVILNNAVYYLPLGEDDDESFSQMRRVIADRLGFTPVVIKDEDDGLGIVTIHDCPSLGEGEIIAPIVGADPSSETFHNNFQDPEAFLRANGRRGRQHQVLVEGTYYINRLFGTVEILPKTIVEVGQVGVVVSFVGTFGADISGDQYKHGELVTRGERGVWDSPFLPGKYAFNLYAGKCISVPTTNFILKWKSEESGTHKFDENLTEVSLITKDAFELSLPLSVVVHINYKKAPLVIQRFGDIKKLVEQTLDPMISSYFKNVGQTRTLIELLQGRSEIQKAASKEMQERFIHYNLELEEVLIGTPSSNDKNIEMVLNQLRSRQVAEEQVETYARQQKASIKERELKETEARARQQSKLTESEISIQIQSNEGKAEYQKAVQHAAQIRTLAEAEAEKSARIGIAQAMAIEEQVKAYGGPQFQVLQQVISRFAEAVENAKIDVVPKVLISSGTTGNTSMIESLIALILSEKAGVTIADSPNETIANIKKSLRKSMGERQTTDVE